MADFPSLTKMYVESAEEILDDLRTDRTVDGTLKSRAFYSSVKRRFTPKFLVTKAERNTLTAFYLANRTASFNFTWPGDGAVYVCRFERAPRYSYNKAGDLNAECGLAEV